MMVWFEPLEYFALTNLHCRDPIAFLSCRPSCSSRAQFDAYEPFGGGRMRTDPSSRYAVP